MKGWIRAAGVLVVVGVAAGAAEAQNVGMPLFANPHFGSGVRLFVDAGRPATALQNADVTTVQGGVGFSVGPVRLGAAVAGNITDIKNCTGQNFSCSQSYFSGAALAGLKLAGGGHNPLALGVFGGLGIDLSSLELAGYNAPRQLTIPVGASVGYKFGPLVLWGAPRYNFYSWQKCDSSQQSCSTTNDFRWSAGVTMPLGIFGIRAAYDGGKINGVKQDFVGVGVSLGIGGNQ